MGWFDILKRKNPSWGMEGLVSFIDLHYMEKSQITRQKNKLEKDISKLESHQAELEQLSNEQREIISRNGFQNFYNYEQSKNKNLEDYKRYLAIERIINKKSSHSIGDKIKNKKDRLELLENIEENKKKIFEDPVKSIDFAQNKYGVYLKDPADLKFFMAQMNLKGLTPVEGLATIAQQGGGPHTQHEGTKIFKDEIKEAVKVFMKLNNRKPSWDEVAEELMIPEEQWDYKADAKLKEVIEELGRGLT